MRNFLLTILFALMCISCTENARVKSYGGTGSINLPKGRKLVTVTWKGPQLWYLTRPMNENDVPESYRFQEESNWGIVEGTYILTESR